MELTNVYFRVQFFVYLSDVSLISSFLFFLLMRLWKGVRKTERNKYGEFFPELQSLITMSFVMWMLHSFPNDFLRRKRKNLVPSNQFFPWIFGLATQRADNILTRLRKLYLIFKNGAKLKKLTIYLRCWDPSKNSKAHHVHQVTH